MNNNNSLPDNAMIPHEDDIEVDDSFFDDDIDVVRAEYASDSDELAISFNNFQLYVNMACIKKLPEIDFVQFLINKTKNQLALLPCEGDDRDAFRWRTINAKSGKKQPKYITAKLLSAMLFDYTGWDTTCRYKLIGKVKKSRGKKLIVFELGSYRAYEKGNGEKAASMGYFPSDWKDRFGMPYHEHKRAYEVSTFKKYATISITDDNAFLSEDPTGEKLIDHENEITASED